jgi:hypothetical protein
MAFKTISKASSASIGCLYQDNPCIYDKNKYRILKIPMVAEVFDSFFTKDILRYVLNAL